MKMHPIKAVLFDLDDTLWATAPVIAQAETALYAWLGAQLPALARRFSSEELRALRDELAPTEARFGFDLWALRHATLTKACALSGADAARVDEAMAVFAAARNAVALFEDVAPGLARLRNRFAVGSVSNGFADLEAIGIAHHFDASLAAHTFGCAKPDPSIFHAACARLGVDPREAVFVGDDPVLDVQAAQRAGLRAVWMNRFDRARPEHVVPDAVCRSLHELDAWLAEQMSADAAK